MGQTSTVVNPAVSWRPARADAQAFWSGPDTESVGLFWPARIAKHLPAFAVILVCAVLAYSSHAADSVTLPSVSSPVTFRDASGHFCVVADERREAFQLLRWIVSTAERVGQLVGSPVPFGDQGLLTLVVRRMGNVEPPRATAIRETDGLRLFQRLEVLTRSEPVDDTVRLASARLLLERYVWAAAGTNRIVLDDHTMPTWLVEGVTQALDVEGRIRNSDWVFREWRRGRLPSISGWLQKVGRYSIEKSPSGCREASTPAASQGEGEGAVAGVCIAWLRRGPEGPRRFQAIWEHLARGEALIPERLARILLGSESARDLDDAWDAWMLREKSTIRAPGRLTARAVEELGSTLLLHPGECGIPLQRPLHEPMPWCDLIRKRDAPWIPTLAQSMRIRLQIYAAGQAREIREVVARYVEFLNALAEHAAERRLFVLLHQAETAWERLRSGVQDDPGGCQTFTAGETSCESKVGASPSGEETE